MAQRSIIVKGDGIRNEALASGAITPGMLVERTSAATDTVKVHATSGAVALPAFAVENDLMGAEIGTAYASAALVQFNIFNSGDEVYALIANGEDITKGDKLVSNGDGYLKKNVLDSSATLDEEIVLCYARETVDMSGSSAVDPSGRCIVEIL